MVAMAQDDTRNPFNITKAVDFSDQEINDYWVDIPETGFSKLAKPTSPMPMLILGGKGSGKTHLMRYFSYPLQKIRNQHDVLGGLRQDGYIGIYLRCGGLNAARFQGKGHEEDEWMNVFAYYMELWLSQLVLDILGDAFGNSEEFRASESEICHSISRLFDAPLQPPPTSLMDLRNSLANMQRELDAEVNNCAISRHLKVEVCATRGKLIFGVPRVLTSHLPSLNHCLFVYLIDEFENLTEAQQKYINTLIREKESPSSFKIGSRLYGIRTYATFSADEENKEGSEFELLQLDTRLRNNKKYNLFAMLLIAKRLQEAGYLCSSADDEDSLSVALNRYFESVTSSHLGKEEAKFVIDKYAGKDRPYFIALRNALQHAWHVGKVTGVESTDTISEIISLLACPDFPLVEKVNIFLLHKDWARNKDLLKTATIIHGDCQHYVANSGVQHPATHHAAVMTHFKSDLLAQLYRECGGNQKRTYTGIETFIEMSWGLPRNLLNLLKYVFSWAVFYGERPFADKPISFKAQESGVAEAVEWFYRDAKMAGTDGAEVQGCINRLGTLLRSIRFSDKPAECSCCSFSADLTRASRNAQKFIDLATKWSQLIFVGDQRDRNTERIDYKFQLNRMLAPRWDLSINRRGVLALTPSEVNAIFDTEHKDRFDGVSQQRVDRMTAPFFGRKGKEKQAKKQSKKQRDNMLPGFEHD